MLFFSQLQLTNLKKGRTHEDLRSLSLTTAGLMTFDEGKGPINLGAKLRESVQIGRSWVGR